MFSKMHKPISNLGHILHPSENIRKLLVILVEQLYLEMSSALQYLVYTEDMSWLEGQPVYLNLKSVETSAVTSYWILCWFLKMYMTVLYNYVPLYIC